MHPNRLTQTGRWAQFTVTVHRGETLTEAEGAQHHKTPEQHLQDTDPEPEIWLCLWTLDSRVPQHRESGFTVVTHASEELERKCSFRALSVQFVAPSLLGPWHGGKDLKEGRGRGAARNQGEVTWGEQSGVCLLPPVAALCRSASF